VDPKKVPKGGPSSKKNSAKPDPNATTPSVTKPKSNLPLGAESAKDLKWQNGRWVNLKHPELVEAPAVSGQDDESYYSSDNDDRYATCTNSIHYTVSRIVLFFDNNDSHATNSNHYTVS
jgi:hypothetical protein